MKAAIISNKSKEVVEKIVKSFSDEGIETQIIQVNDLALLTESNKTRIFFDSVGFSGIDACFLDVGQEFTPFVEPLLDEFKNKGIYCQRKQESFYINSNRPFQLVVLNSKGIKITKTSIIQDPALIDSAVDDFMYPLLLKTFLGGKKMQSLLVESKRSLTSFAKSLKTELDSLSIQEYLEGDLMYAAVIGKEVFSMKKNWNEEKLEHDKKALIASLSEKDKAAVLNAVDALGLDMAVVKMISGHVIAVRPEVDFELFNNVTGKDLYTAMAYFFKSKLESD